MISTEHESKDLRDLENEAELLAAMTTVLGVYLKHHEDEWQGGVLQHEISKRADALYCKLLEMRPIPSLVRAVQEVAS